MCFSIPYKVISVLKDKAVVEGNKTIYLGKKLKAKKGDYVRTFGNVAVDVLSQKEGMKVRKVIKSLSEK